MPALCEVAEKDELPVRMMAVEALGGIGSGEGRVIEVLTKACSDPDDFLRKLAAQSLGQIGEPALPGVLALLRDGGPQERLAAARALEHMGPGVKDAFPTLRGLFQDRDESVRKFARRTFGEAE